MIEVKNLVKRYGNACGGRPAELYCGRGADLWFSRAKRRRKIHDNEHYYRLSGCDGRRSHDQRTQYPGGAGGSQEMHRISSGDSSAVYGYDRNGVSEVCGGAEKIPKEKERNISKRSCLW